MERKIGLFSAARLFERFLAPGIPVHRIMRVLEKIRTLLLARRFVCMGFAFPFGDGLRASGCGTQQ